MEGIAPVLRCLIETQSVMKNGQSLRAGLLSYLRNSSAGEPLNRSLKAFLFAWDQGHDWRVHVRRMQSPQRRALVELMASGLGGQSVLNQMEELKSEIVFACEIEIKRHIEMLPIKMLVPLLLCQFPAFLLLMFGPMLKRFLEELSR